MPRSFRAKYQSECLLCHNVVMPGDEAFFPPGSNGKIAHFRCPISYPVDKGWEYGTKTGDTPPAASSVGQEGPKEARSGVESSPPPAAPEDPWVEIGAWVHASKVDLMLKAIKEART